MEDTQGQHAQEETTSNQATYVPQPPNSQATYTPQPPNNPAGGSGKKEPFYKKSWFVVLMLIIFPIVGIPLALVFKKPENKTARIILIVFASLLVIYTLFVPKGTSTSSSSTQSNQSQQTETKSTQQQATLDSITASYTGSVEDGTAINAKTTGLKVVGTYSDGTTKTVTDFSVDNPTTLVSGQTSTINISSSGKTCAVNIACAVKVPTEYKTALNKAQSYVDKMYLSKQGLYDQLTSEYGEKYSAEAAQYAVDNVKTDWNANALKKAQQYQSKMNMSPSAIYDQLTSAYGEQFTAAEAQYAIDHLS